MMRANRRWMKFIFASVVSLTCAQPGDAQQTAWPDPVANDVLPYATAGLSHGPLLGRVTDRSVRVWVRTRQPTAFEVLYDTHLPLDDESASVAGLTTDDADLTGVVDLQGLSQNTRYYYAVRIEGTLPDLRPDITDPWPSFQHATG